MDVPLFAKITCVAPVIVVESRRAGLSPALVLAVIQIESRGYNFAASRVGALGLMQLRPVTAEARRTGGRWRGHATLFDPVANVRLGVSYLERAGAARDGDLPPTVLRGLSAI